MVIIEFEVVKSFFLGKKLILWLCHVNPVKISV